ncbi:MAG: cell envelope biogenesis protein LolA [Croceibacter sp.]|nr:cell envelope biogenesis protein LolA [Croceibacter sp.]|tara:strand:+ start:1212 stop:1841 length:630 start_codon:yes stop_codon:yes gene_type:complete
MRKLITLIFIFGLLLSSVAQEKSMSKSEIQTFKENVKASAKSITTIKSDFTQYKHLDILSNDIETNGHMVFKSPNLVKWQYTKPFSYSVIFKEDQLLINDDGTKSNVDIGSSKLFKNLNELIISSIKGDMFIENDFNISYLKSNTYYKATFIPKEKAILNYIAQFELLFDKTNAQVFEVKMIEPSQDYTRIVFKNRVLNTPVSNAVFTH